MFFKSCKNLDINPEGSTSVRRRSLRPWNNSKMYLKESRFTGVDWTHLAHNRIQMEAAVNT